MRIGVGIPGRRTTVTGSDSQFASPVHVGLANPALVTTTGPVGSRSNRVVGVPSTGTMRVSVRAPANVNDTHATSPAAIRFASTTPNPDSPVNDPAGRKPRRTGRTRPRAPRASSASEVCDS